MKNAWRLAVGTLTALPVTPPRRVDRDTAGLAMVLAPLAVVPLGVAVGVVLWAADALDLAPLAAGFGAVGVLALGSRAFHLDGLADTADGLTASYDRVRALEVMRSGAAGPAGVAALVVVLGLQATGFAALVDGRGPVVAGVVVCASRVALTLTCARGVPAARPDGLGATAASSVPRPVAVLAWLAAAALSGATVTWADGEWWHVVVGLVVAAVLVATLVARAVRRLGGVTGDVFGAAVELALAALVVSVYQVQ